MKKFPILSIFSFLLLFGCGSNETKHFESSDFEEITDIPVTEQPPPPSPGEFGGAAPDMKMEAPNNAPYQAKKSDPSSQNLVITDRQIIKTADIGFEVEKLAEAKTKIDNLIHQYNGYTASENQNNSVRQLNLNLTIRVPSSQFEALLNSLSGLGKRIDYKRVEAQDVTEQYIDIKTRLETKKKIEERYLQLLKKANNIKDILEVEEKIRYLREEIEAKEGQLKYLSNRVQFSTVNLHVYEVIPYEHLPGEPPAFGQKLLSSLENGWQLLMGITLGIISIWPIAIILLIGLIYLIKRTRGRKLIK